MLKYDIKKLFRIRGIDNPVKFLISKGYHKDTAYRLLKNKAINLQSYQIEDFCKWFDCTPNDLLEWIPDKNDKPEDYPALMKLMPVKLSDFRLLAKDLPIEKVNELYKKIEELKKEI